MKKKQIMLFDPPFQRFMGFSKTGIPLGLLYIAGELKHRGHEVSVFDADYNPKGSPYPFITKIQHYHDYLDHLNDKNHPIWEDIALKIEEKKPEIVGITFVSPKLKSGLRIAEIAKNLGVKKVIMGGPHATIRPNDAIKSDYVDTVVQGEGEFSFETAIEQQGIIKRSIIKNIDSLVWPARGSLVGLERYQEKDLGYIITARGCPNNCNFCCSNALWGGHVRMRKIEDVVAEMDHVHNSYQDREEGMREFYLIDDTFTLSKKRVNNFCDMIEDREYKWSCLTRVDRIDKYLLEKMMNSGCSLIKVGIESGSQKVLDLMNKRTTIKEIEDTAELLNEKNMPWLAYIMVGVPGETVKDTDKTIRIIEKIKPSYISASIYAPYPGTGFSNPKGDVDFAWEAASHNSMEVLAGNVPREKIIEFMKFVDNYNSRSNVAREIYKC
jgi:radical SAM superfamily enzyme YgiQ (UPF0313 family)